MAKRNTFRSNHLRQEPDGRIRRSQIITTYGPGAMVDLLHDAVLISGLETWKSNQWVPVDEPRLRDTIAKRLEKMGRKLRVDGAFRMPPVGNEDSPSKYDGIEAREFPSWFLCQNAECRALVRSSSLERKRDRYIHDCTRSGSECVPVRFVSACNHGHLDEFPWVWFAHKGEQACDHPRLRFDEGATGDFGTMVVRCTNCKSEHRLVDALDDEGNPRCRGLRPWLGYGDETDTCTERQRLLVRTASNSYFSQVESALSIPETGPQLYDLVQVHWKVLQAGNAATLPSFRVIPDIREALEDFSDEEVLKHIEMVKEKRPPERLPIRTAEFLEFVKSPKETLGELPKRSDSFFARKLTTEPPNGIKAVVLAHKLREVRVQIGFTRLEAVSPNLQGAYDVKQRTAPLAITQDWLPAVEILGEGIFIQLDEARVREWEARPAVLKRGQELLESFDAAMEGVEESPEFPGMRFYLLHSLSHLLVTALSLECGYSASAIRERIYCSTADDPTPMAAILLSTGTPGSEGTLGGLVEEGRKLAQHLKRAYELAELCSNDPVCASHDPRDSSERPLDGAACHGCLYIAEPSCEWHNRYLDRALVVPTLLNQPGLPYFGESP